MNADQIVRDFQDKVCVKLSLRSEGIDRFRVSTPFMFEDGDHLVVVLKDRKRPVVPVDEGHTYMHLTYDVDEQDLHRGT